MKTFPRIIQNINCRFYSSKPNHIGAALPKNGGVFDVEAINHGNSALTITDPFLVYQSYIKLGKLCKDESQLRVMKEFQKLYQRLIGYTPDSEKAVKRALLLRKLEVSQAKEDQKKQSFTGSRVYDVKKWIQKDPDSKNLEIIKFMTDEEELHNICSPQGLMVNGGVGCGKSMLMDIFASCLPYESKMRSHYNNFILWVFEEIHKIQNERRLYASVGMNRKFTMENEYILFEIAQKMIEKSTVFMLDEFMLPDVAAAQIVRILFIHYFKLGGVLVATSNKLPEELYSSQFNKSRFKSFVGLLHSRCVSIDMRSKFDYRRHFAQTSAGKKHIVVQSNNPDHEKDWNNLILNDAIGVHVFTEHPISNVNDVEWVSAKICVYNRTSVIPKTFKNIICWVDFDFICKSSFSASDYITLASKFKVFIIDDVPIMTAKMKNEARRFITLLDALYEARCQLFLRCTVTPDKLFFPSESLVQANREIVQEEEMYAKTAMQTLQPYRPNVSSYDQLYARVYTNVQTGKAKNVNFGDLKAFTGEDEKFAYKRAVSRIHEMVASERWHDSCQWNPLDPSMRPWEKRIKADAKQNHPEQKFDTDFSFLHKEIKELKNILKTDLPRNVSSLLGISFAQFNSKVSPSFVSMLHFWRLGEWLLDQQKNIKDKIARAWVSGKNRKS